MKLAVPKEVFPGETRVAAVPVTVRAYVQAGFEVAVESGAGVAAQVTDSAYQAAGATIEPDAERLLAEADVILKVQPPQQRGGGADEADLLKSGSVLVSMLLTRGDGRLIEKLASRGVSAFALEAVPRIARAQSMDVLSSQATITGYKAVLLAADAIPRMIPMMMTAAGTIQPAHALIIGAGVAGLEAIGMARKLGAVVQAVDTRPAVKEQVESLGARFIPLEVEHEKAQGAGGYAQDLGENFYRGEQEIIAPHLKDVDFVITSAAIPRRSAPRLITEAMVAQMRRGAVIIDLAAGTGGNCTLTVADQWVDRDGVKIYGPTNLPAAVPVHASLMLARNIAAFFGELAREGVVKIDTNNEIIRAMLITHAGAVVRGESADRPAAAATKQENRP